MNTTCHYSLTTCKCTGLLMLIWFPFVTLQKYSPSDPSLTLRGNMMGYFFVVRTSLLPFTSSRVRGDGHSDGLHSNITVDFRKAILGPVSSGLRVDPSVHNTEITDITSLTLLYCIIIFSGFHWTAQHGIQNYLSPDRVPVSVSHCIVVPVKSTGAQYCTNQVFVM